MIGAELRIHRADESDQRSWDEYVWSHPDGVAYQFFAWKKAVEDAYGFDCPYFIAKRNRKVVGVFPLSRIHLPFCAGSLVSLPYCDIGGGLADSESIAQALLDKACRFAADRGIRSIEIRAAKNPPSASLYNKATPLQNKVRMLLKLPDSGDALMKGFKSKLRSQVRKPSKDGLTAKIGGLSFLDDFYRVFAENMRDLGSPVHSRKWIASVLAFYEKSAKCCVVYMPDGEPAASGIILCHSRTVSIPWASSLRRLNRWNPNMLLYWSLLEYAAESGFDSFDFGRSTLDEGTYRFKKQWGAMPTPLFWLRHSVVGFSKKRQKNRSFLHMSRNFSIRNITENIVQKLPVNVATFLGGHTRRYVSL